MIQKHITSRCEKVGEGHAQDSCKAIAPAISSTGALYTGRIEGQRLNNKSDNTCIFS